MREGQNSAVFLLFSLLPLITVAQETVNLDKPGDRPILYVYRPVDTRSATHTAVIVCSGGSYGRTADDEEGIPAAKLLAVEGITAFLLDYRLPEGKDSLPLGDAQRAIRWVRGHAKEYDVAEDKVGIMGFSAGGHLVSTIGTHWRNNYDTALSAASARPDFMVLVYPVISFVDSLTHFRSRRNFLGDSITPDRIREFSNEGQVSDDTPPAFIVAAVDDPVVKVENSLYFEAALRQHGVAVEMFLYAKGGHGFGIDNQTASVQWTGACVKWIKKL